MKSKIKNKKKNIKSKKHNNVKIVNTRNVTILLVFVVTFMFIYITENNKIKQKDAIIYTNNESTEVSTKVEPVKKITDWKITLVNSENELPEDYEFELSNIDQHRKFDSRAIGELNKMMNDIRKSGITNIWVQSSYRSVEDQKNVFNESVNKYMKKGMSEEDAITETLKLINKPGTSEHNLGLAVDFNNVDISFEKLNCFKWLVKNAEDYGFILRYPKDKYDITKVEYEPWHWRYVGSEHAKEINRLNFCLEEYIDYLIKEKLI